MNAARKALINIQQASPGLPVGRFHPQLAIIADFFDTLVNLQIQNEALGKQLLEAHEQFASMLRNMSSLPASVPDQAQLAASGIRGNSIDLMIVDDIAANFFANLPPRAEILIPAGFKMSEKAVGLTYDSMLLAGWNHNQLVIYGYVVRDEANAVYAGSGGVSTITFGAGGASGTPNVNNSNGSGGGGHMGGRTSCINCVGLTSKTQRCDHA